MNTQLLTKYQQAKEALEEAHVEAQKNIDAATKHLEKVKEELKADETLKALIGELTGGKARKGKGEGRARAANVTDAEKTAMQGRIEEIMKKSKTLETAVLKKTLNLSTDRDAYVFSKAFQAMKDDGALKGKGLGKGAEVHWVEKKK